VARVVKQLNAHIADSDVPRDRKMMCNPDWRQHTKSKWTHQKGFMTGLRQNFPLTTEQAWTEVKVGEAKEMYQGGHFDVGHEFRPPRQEVRKDIAKEAYYVRTKPNYLHKGTTL
jgi:hypothetical protein